MREKKEDRLKRGNSRRKWKVSGGNWRLEKGKRGGEGIKMKREDEKKREKRDFAEENSLQCMI